MGWIHGYNRGKDIYLTFEEAAESRQVCKACLEEAFESHSVDGKIATHQLVRLDDVTTQDGHILSIIDGLPLCATEARQKLIDEQKDSEAIKVAKEKENATANASAILSDVVAKVSCPDCLNKIAQEAGDMAYYHKYLGGSKWMDDNYGGGHLSYFDGSSKFEPVCGADPYYGE